MADALHFRKTESDARFLPLAPEGGAFRIVDGFIELKDEATETFQPIYRNNGALQIGPAE